MSRSIILVLFAFLVVGCSKTPKSDGQIDTNAKYSNELLFSVYKNTLNLTQEDLYVTVNGKRKFVGTRTTAHSIFRPASSEFVNHGSAQAYFYYRGVNAKDTNTWLTVVGHTDSSGDSAKNFELSKKRSYEIASIAAMANPNLNDYYQYGDYLPAFSNATKEGRAKNRRVELLEFSNEADLDAYINQNYNEAFTKEIAARQKKVNQTGVTAAKPSKPKPIVTKPAQRKTGQYVEFGGSMLSRHRFTTLAALGPATENKPVFGISRAVAADISDACINDSPPYKTKDKDLRTSDYFPLMNETPWWGIVNKHGVLVSPVAVNKDDATATAAPTIYVYKNFKKGQKPTYTYKSDVVVYEGEKHILYRVFPRDASKSLQCIDMLLSKEMNKSNRKAIKGNILYDSKQGLKVVNFLPVQG
ncbi:OmpA family protein [Enterovibrio nigricans]|nr:OmpA family protein [Enterovibrio nigricans]